MPSEFQAILLDKRFFTRKSANAWIRKQGFHPIKQLHETEKYYRSRLINPAEFKEFRIMTLSGRIKVVLGINNI
jgi:hypothetical protein